MANRPRKQPLWARRETWMILFCAIVVVLLVLGAIGYWTGGWTELPQ